MPFQSKRFGYKLISDRDHERALDAVNHDTSQGWRVTQMCVDADGDFVFLLEMKFDLRGKQPLSQRLAAGSKGKSTR